MSGISVDDYYSVGDLIGAGAFGTVHAGQRLESDTQVAIKVIDKDAGSSSLEHMRREIQMMPGLVHDNLVKFLQVFETPRSVYYISEHAGDDLLDSIIEREDFTEKGFIDVLRSTLNAVAFLHNANIHHLNVKPENLLLAPNAPYCCVKLADCGLSVLTERAVFIASLAQHAPYFMAPEMLSSMQCGPESDVWSVGVLAALLGTGTYPFPHESLQGLFVSLLEGRYNVKEGADPLVRDFVKRTLVIPPEKRLNASEALEQPLVQADGRTEVKTSLIDSLRAYSAERKVKKAARAAMDTETLVADLASRSVTPFATAAVPGDTALYKNIQ